ncbi:DUF7344 domain-containing protein [Halorussus marinus]|uniref:DUF7344 domain-containing protein n=1 Tax=Halorussus marinus TaxID=2505976 RepID=UPI0010923CC6|nr:hypothetical protein [Halorussus marinus]
MGQTPNTFAGVQQTSEPSGAGHGSRDRSLDAVFEMLRSERRRNALYVLYRRPGPIQVSALADEVATREGVELPRVATALRHVHLPKLDDAGAVEFDHETGSVRLGDDSGRLREYLTAAAADEGLTLRRASASATLSEF